MSPTHYYFAYGSNMNPRRMEARGLPFEAYWQASLESYQLVFNKRAHNKVGIGYANIAYRVGHRVQGVLYQLCSHSELVAMDHYEGTPVRYSREVFPVRRGDETLHAWVYVANPAYIESELAVEENYLNHLLAAAHLLPGDYVDQLRQQPVLPATAVNDEQQGLLFNV